MEDAAIEALDAPVAVPAPVTELPAAPDPEVELDGQAAKRSPAEGQQLVLDLIAAHADSLLRTARRYSLCADDAQDAYQRGLEILMRHAHRIDADRAGGWLHTVVKREAMAINRSRRRFVGGDEVDLDALETRTSPSPEDRVLGFERVARSAEALQRLKPQEVRALWLKAMGNSYQEICDQTGWTYTKVNRCLAEGRKSFLARYAGIEAGEECRRWAPVLSAMVDGEATAEQMLELRPHLRNCAGCRAALRELRGSTAPLVAVFPVGGLALAGGEDGPLGGAADSLSRMWHALWGDLSEKAATAAFRAQAAAQGMLPGKAVATAASALALAGGGYAVEGAHEPVSPPRAVLHAHAPSTAVQRLTVAARTATAAPLVVREPAATRSAPRRVRRARPPRARRRTVVRAVRAPRRSPARVAPTRAAAAPAAVVSSTPSTPSPAPTARPVAPRVAAPAPRPPATTGATAEFGLERR